MIAAIEFGGTKTVVAIGTAGGDITALTRFATSDGRGTLAEAVAWIEQHGQPSAIGVAAFGPVCVDARRPDFGTLLDTPKPGWSQFSISGALRSAFPQARLVLDTDVNAAALAESAGIEDLVYITVGTGIGAGIVSGGHLLHGALHPEFGHLRVPRIAEDAFEGACPFHGHCLEGLASGAALRQRWGVEAHTLPADHRAWEWQTTYLAHGVLALLAIVCPSRVVIGGGVSQMPGFHARVEDRLRALAGDYFPALRNRPYVVPPKHGDLSGIRGALMLTRA